MRKKILFLTLALAGLAGAGNGAALALPRRSRLPAGLLPFGRLLLLLRPAV